MKKSRCRRRLLSCPSALRLAGRVILLVGCAGALAWAQSDPAAPRSGLPARIALVPGQIWSFTGETITRIAVGDPEIVDVTVVSEHEALLQAKQVGATNIILWDASGKQTASVEVIDEDRTPEAIHRQMEQLVRQLNLPNVSVQREGAKFFLIGDAPDQEAINRLEQMIASFPDVTNLVSVLPEAEAPLLLVRLMVQLIEISRTDLERLGVSWLQSVQVTQPETEDLTLGESLFRWGTGLTRGNVSSTIQALVTKNKARILAEPKLVTTNGTEASSQLGADVPYLTTTTVGTGTGASSASVDFRKTGVLLTMTPRVDPKDPDRRITMKMTTEVSKIDTSIGLQVPVGGQVITVPGFKVRQAKTEITTVSGETVVIAGLLELEESANVNQVPALGSMPFFGRLFRAPEQKAEQRELVITVTPELLDDTRVTMEKAVALEQSLAVPDVTPSVTDPMLRYALQVQERIAKSLRYPDPEKAAGLSAQVKLRVHLLRDGTLEQALVAESSGFEVFDQAAVRAAKSQSPFPMFPPQLLEPEVWLEVPILFRP